MVCDITVINRIKRVRGQIDGILKMIEENRSCEDLMMQLKASKSSLERTIKILAVNNLINKIENEYNLTIESVEKEIDLIVGS